MLLNWHGFAELINSLTTDFDAALNLICLVNNMTDHGARNQPLRENKLSLKEDRKRYSKRRHSWH